MISIGGRETWCCRRRSSTKGNRRSSFCRAGGVEVSSSFCRAGEVTPEELGRLLVRGGELSSSLREEEDTWNCQVSSREVRLGLRESNSYQLFLSSYDRFGIWAPIPITFFQILSNEETLIVVVESPCENTSEMVLPSTPHQYAKLINTQVELKEMRMIDLKWSPYSLRIFNIFVL